MQLKGNGKINRMAGLIPSFGCASGGLQSRGMRNSGRPPAGSRYFRLTSTRNAWDSLGAT
jgi:hypothetical protein